MEKRGTYPDSRIHYIPIQFVLELQEPPEIINRGSIHSYSVCTTAPRVPIILLIRRPPFLILAGGRGPPNKTSPRIRAQGARCTLGNRRNGEGHGNYSRCLCLGHSGAGLLDQLGSCQSVCSQKKPDVVRDQCG